MARELTEQELRRREELEQIRAKGIQPYPYEWDVTDRAENILNTFDDAVHQPSEEGEAKERYTVSVAGRTTSFRGMGKAAFFDLLDDTDALQLYVCRDDQPDGLYNQVIKMLFDTGGVVGICRTVFRS